MTNPSRYLISPTASIKDAIEVIDRGSAQVALVIDNDGKLLGIVTDGDVRRAILRGIVIDEVISLIMVKTPVCVKEGTSRENALGLMRQKAIHHIPIVSDSMRILGLFVIDDLLQKPSFPNHIVLMAGGKGQRLKPLTDNCPKPMLKVNGKPILETIMMRCVDAGFKNFHISINYLKEQITDYFQDGTKWGVNINYLEENEFLGTSGCLKLLPHKIPDDIVVINGDIITDLDLDRLIRFHLKANNVLTVCSRAHRVRVPFAVLSTKLSCLKSFVEKPMYEYQVNAGVYVLKKKCIEEISAGFFDMTDLIDKILEQDNNVSVFPIHENWKDIGNPDDFNEVNN